MKRVIAWVLLLTLCLGLFAGCKKNKDNQDPTTNNGEVVETTTADLEAALEYIKTVYKKVGEKTPKDYQRIGNVPVNGKDYEVVWSADVGEEYIKVVKGTDGMVTIDVNEKVEAEVKYVLTATISDDAGNSVSHSWNHLIPTASNMAAIVEEAYLLKNGESMGYEVTLTGKITSINTPWDAGYKNITVTIVVEGAEDKPIMCYRLKGEGADKLKPNDIITVTGTIKNYNGTIEFDAGCTLDAVIEGEEIKAPTDPKQILKDAYALKEGGALPYKATLTGVISKVNTEYSPQYKNVTVTIVIDGDEKRPVQCYRLAGNGADKIDKGDTITVTGWIVNYKGTVQFGQGCTLDSWKDTGANVPKPEDTFTTTLVPEIVTEPVPGTAYKFFMYQKSFGKNFYLTGKMDGFYYETTYDPAKAVDVYVEEVSGGYRLYFMENGAKKYLETVREMGSDGKMHNNVVFTATPKAVLKWNDAIKSFTCELEIDGEKKDYYWGTYSFYKTFSASDVSRITGKDADKMDTENFVGRLAVMKETSVTPAEKAFEQLKNDYPAASGVENTTENYTRKNVYDVDGNKIKVEWTENGEAVEIVDNGDGTVTVKVTRGEKDAPYTLTATITDGDKKYTESWKCNVPAVPPTGDMAIVDAAYALESGTSMADEVTLTGAITFIDTPYDSNYGNITVTIAVARREYKSIMCYRMKGEGAEALAVGDTITVTGKIKNYGGIIEFDAGCKLDNVVKGNGPAFTAPATQNEVMAEALTLEPMTSLPYSAELTGVIVDAGSFDASYGNITLHIQIGETFIECYRMKGEGADDLVIGDTITVAGMLTNVEGNLRLKAGCQLIDADRSQRPGGEEPQPPVDPDIPEIPEEPKEELEELTVTVTKPVETAEMGVGYKYYMVQVATGKTLYFNGQLSGNYLATTENVAEAVDVFVEEATGGYNLYFMNGEVKTYIGIEEYEYEKNGQMKTSARVTLTEAPNVVFTVNAELGIYQAVVNNTTYYIGTYSTYNTMSASKISYINADNMGVSQFPAVLCTVVELPATPEAGTAYKYYVKQAKLDNKVLYFNGQLSGNYLATTENAAEAVDVFVEEATGGYNLYFMDGEAKTYIVVEEYEYEKNGQMKTSSKIVFSDTPAVFTVNEDLGILQTVVNETAYYIGTYNTYETMSASKTSYINADNMGVSQFPALFGLVHIEGEGEAPEETPEEIVATLNLADSANRTSYTTSQQVWEQNGVTFTNDKAASSNNVGDYVPARLYVGSSVTIAHPGMTKIEFTCNSGKPVANLTDSLANIPGITVTTEGSVVTVEFAIAIDSFTIPSIVAQVRLDAVTVYASAGSSEPAETTAELNLADSANRTSYTTSQQVWEQNGVTFTNDKAASSSNVGDYVPARLYVGSSVTIAHPGMTKIEFTCNSGKPVANLTDSLADIAGITVSTEGSVVTVTFETATDSFTIPAIVAQVRLDSLTVYATLASSGSQGGNTGSGGSDDSGSQTPSTPSTPPITNVEYTYGSSSAYSNVIKNWGRRGFNATFLSPNAVSFYADNDVTYEELAALEGAATTNNVPSSVLYTTLQELMESNHTEQTTYGDTRYLYCYTDCQDQDSVAGISCFYSGQVIGPSWDSGSTWNREHCWPKSKSNATWNSSNSNGNTGELGDLMTLRPVVSNINSSRSNKAYGISNGFYDPNAVSNGAYNLHGDVARIVLYTYVRWEDSAHMWGEEGVIENVDVLLDWMAEDPVDTWEMGRNDSVESVTGTRNVFVDYPELAFILFGEEVPNMVTPSGKAAA